jgi:hypothetical protein
MIRDNSNSTAVTFMYLPPPPNSSVNFKAKCSNYLVSYRVIISTFAHGYNLILFLGSSKRIDVRFAANNIGAWLEYSDKYEPLISLSHQSTLLTDDDKLIRSILPKKKKLILINVSCKKILYRLA